jgi:hypothetical protein
VVLFGVSAQEFRVYFRSFGTNVSNAVVASGNAFNIETKIYQ